MGCSGSKESQEAFEKARQIDRQLKEEMKIYTEQIKLLLLGAGESGKSTIAKQMVILHKEGYLKEERLKFKSVVHCNIFIASTTLIKAMAALEIPFERPENEARSQKVLAMATPFAEEITPDMAELLKALWTDKGTQVCYSRSREFQLDDSAKYYLDDIDRISQPSYIPSEQDILRTRVKTTGITEIKYGVRIEFSLQETSVENYGLSNARPILTTVRLIVRQLGFMVLREDEEVNRMRESLNLFDSTCNNTWFTKTSMVLFLNKKDIFEEKIRHSPITICFPEYTGGNGYDETAAYIREQFENLNAHPTTKEIYSHFTCATDTKNIEVVFDAVADVITQSNMKEIGLI